MGHNVKSRKNLPALILPTLQPHQALQEACHYGAREKMFETYLRSIRPGLLCDEREPFILRQNRGVLSARA
jgi:hypothetical protein